MYSMFTEIFMFECKHTVMYCCVLFVSLFICLQSSLDNSEASASSLEARSQQALQKRYVHVCVCVCVFVCATLAHTLHNNVNSVTVEQSS